MKDIEKAKELLHSGDYTCVVCKGEELYTSTLRGVKPLVQWYDADRNFKDFSAADKVVGKATAVLYALLKIKSVYARVVSKAALEVLKTHKIIVEYDTLVENIINRQGDDICPFEKAVLDVADTQIAYEVIRNKMRELNISL